MDRKYSLIITDTHANSLCSYAALARRISAEVRSHLVSEVVAWLLRVAGVFSYISVEEAPPTTRAKGPRRQCAAQSGAYGEAISVNGNIKPYPYTHCCVTILFGFCLSTTRDVIVGDAGYCLSTFSEMSP